MKDSFTYQDLNELVHCSVKLSINFHIVELLFVNSIAHQSCSEMCQQEASESFQKVLKGVRVVIEAQHTWNDESPLMLVVLHLMYFDQNTYIYLADICHIVGNELCYPARLNCSI